MTAVAGEDASSARDQVLLSGLTDWVALDRIHSHVSRENRGDVLPVIQEKTLELIRSLVGEGLFDVGDLQGENGRFAGWTTSLDESIQRIRDVYVSNFDDRYAWGWFCWLSLTENGQRVADGLSRTSALATPPMTVDEIRAEQQRLLTAPSLVDVVSGYVEELTAIDAESAPEWLRNLDIPSGWRRDRPAAEVAAQPARVAVYESTADGSWDALETLALFRFTGCPPADVVHRNSDRTLRELRAPLGDAACSLDPPRTEVLATGDKSGVIAVRGTGSFVFCRRWMWAQFNTYIACSEIAGQSRMLLQCLYSSREDELAADLASLAETVCDAFIATVH